MFNDCLTNLVTGFRQLLKKHEDDPLLKKIDSEMHSTYFATKLRNEPEVHMMFFDTFVRCIVGKHQYDQNVNRALQLSGGKKISDSHFGTASDEAMALLVFENGYEVWQEVFEKSDGKIYPVPKNQEFPKEWMTTKTTKYTTKKDEEGKPIDTNNKSWSKEGIMRYNELLYIVIRDRMKNKQKWVHEFIELMKKDKKMKGKRKYQ